MSKINRLLDLKPKEIKEIRSKLVEALEAGCSIKSACMYAQISEEEYEAFVRMNPEIAELHEHAESVLGTQAIINVANAIKRGDLKTSKWYLGKVDEKFNQKRISVDNPVLVPVEQKELEMQKLLSQFAAPESFSEDE